jgi:hypothetical protein
MQEKKKQGEDPWLAFDHAIDALVGLALEVR